MDAAGSLSGATLQVTVAVLIGTASVLAYLLRRWRPWSSGPKGMPSDGVFTLGSLAHFDGTKLPLCMGVCGKVVDCSGSENIKAGEGYGKLWAGRDATYALATLSLKAEHANRLDFTLDDFTADQRKALAGWYKHFTTKYTIVGKLSEYEGWDFSSVEKEAETQTPFASTLNKGSGEASGPAVLGVEAEAAKEVAAKAAPGAPAKPAAPEGMRLAKGDRVVLKGLQAKPELNGRSGILRGFKPDAGRFEVEVDLDGKSEMMLFKPDNLSKPE